MLNKSLKEEYSKIYQQEIDTYNGIQSTMVQNTEILYKERKRLVRQLDRAYKFINHLKNTPEEINVKVEKIKLNLEAFETLITYSEKHVDQMNLKQTAVATTSVAAGIGVAGLAPSLALGIATTFGTASTGTAISALSGAAASKAALAWLGGGALTAGGGGVAAGNALLALAGPIGWAIGGAGLIGGVLSISGNNKQAAIDAMSNSAQIRGQYKAMAAISIEIDKMSKLTLKNKHGIRKLLDELVVMGITNYLSTTAEQKYILGSLVNNVFSTTELLNGVIGENGKFVNSEGEQLIKDGKISTQKNVFDVTELQELIHKHKIDIPNLYIFDMEKPKKLIQNAIKFMAPDILEEDIILLYNQSVINRMDKGFILTKQEIIVNQYFDKPYRIEIKDIENLSQDETSLTLIVKNSEQKNIKLQNNDITIIRNLLREVIYYLKTIA